MGFLHAHVCVLLLWTEVQDYNHVDSLTHFT